MKLGTDKNITAPRVVGILTKDKDENLIWTYMKTCSLCGIEQPLTEYHYKRGQTQNRCKKCRSKYQAEHYKKNRERERVIRKAWYEANKLMVSVKGKEQRRSNPEKYRLGRKLQKYNLTKEQYEKMLADQNGACKLCHNPFVGTPHIDHCHNSLIVRGLLCAQCNTGFGLLREDVAIFKRCIAHAKKYKNQGIKSL